MNWKIVVLGGLAYFVGTWAVGMLVSGPLIHEGVLDEAYRMHAQFWRPELVQDPPDMAALMPRWIASGLISSLIVALIYGWVRPALSGAAWMKGLKYGIGMAVFSAMVMLGWSGVFNLPNDIWIWWGIEGLGVFAVGGIVLALAAEKLAPS